MKKVIVASSNPVKLMATLRGFQAMFPDEEFTVHESAVVSSGVPDQPVGDNQTLIGAVNRVAGAMQAHPDADYCVGIEGGIDIKAIDMHGFAWALVASGNGRTGRARTATFMVPPKVAELIIWGYEMGAANDKVFRQVNSKQQGGAVGLLTDGAIDRTAYYTHAVTLALIPFKHPELYSNE